MGNSLPTGPLDSKPRSPWHSCVHVRIHTDSGLESLRPFSDPHRNVLFVFRFCFIFVFYTFLLIYLTSHTKYLPPKYTLVNNNGLSFLLGDVIKRLDESISGVRLCSSSQLKGTSYHSREVRVAGTLKRLVSHLASTSRKQAVMGIHAQLSALAYAAQDPSPRHSAIYILT